MIFNIIKANDLINGLTAEKATLIGQLETKEGELSLARKSFEDQCESIKALTETNATLSKEIETLKAAKTVEVAEAENSAAKQAAAIVASVGIEAGAIKDTKETAATPVKNDGDYLKEFLAMPSGKAKNDFYTAHRDLILKAQGIKK